MRTIRIKVYKFNELNETAKQKALEVCAYYNVDHEWWESTYEDAKRIKLEIEGFDIDRKTIDGGTMEALTTTAELIKTEHGKDCATYKIAEEFLTEWAKLVAHYSDGVKTDQVAEGNEDEFDEKAEDLEQYYQQQLLQSYLQILTNEYDYLTSKEAIAESIEANEYEFTVEGNRS